MKSIHLAAALGVAGSALALAASGASAADDKRAETVIIMKERVAGDAAASAEDGGPRIRAFTLTDGAAVCSGDKDEVSQQSGDGNEKTHIILCSKGDGASSEERARRLEHALARVEQNQELSAEHKAKVVAALREAIARLQATP
jgi:hypothetical protein